jgi:hypothetical protein
MDLKFSQSVCATDRAVKKFINNPEYNSSKEITNSHVIFNLINKHEYSCDSHPIHSRLDSFQSTFLRISFIQNFLKLNGTLNTHFQ